MTDFLLELFSEEIPARMQENAAIHLRDSLVSELNKVGLSLKTADYYYTPRRLCVHITELSIESQSTTEEKRGPKVDAPEQAIHGFLKTTGFSKEQLEIRQTDKGNFYFAIIKNDAKQTTDILSKIIPNIIRNFPWQKSMRWGSGSLRWVRPLHHILCLFKGEIVKFSVDNIHADNFTFGHRFLAPEKIIVSDFNDYKIKLKTAFVMLNQQERKDFIKKEIDILLKPLNVSVIHDENLLNEVIGLVEYPVPLVGKINTEFQDLPPELLSLTMKVNQKYFSAKNKDGKITHYVTISNMKTVDNGATILQGNQRVLAARLNDAKFFYEQDLQKPLLQYGEKLKNVTYHAKLGSQTDRIERMDKIAELLAPLLNADINHIKRSVLLSKCDLTTGIVGEFPELQGIIGKYYALAQGEHFDVADAIENHYSPKGANDNVPTNTIAIIIALADRLDQLCGFWTIDEKPTGSKDPFALRRAALGIIRIVVNNNLSIHLLPIISMMTDIYKSYGNIEIIEDLFTFFHDRLKVYLRDENIRHDIVNAVLFGDNLYKIVDNAKILNDFIQTQAGINLLAGYKRASNIVKAEEKKDSCIYEKVIPETQFLTNYEKSLAKELSYFTITDNFQENLQKLSALNPIIQAFFDNLIVNDDDKTIRLNRLNLLGGFRFLCDSVCEFDKIA